MTIDLPTTRSLDAGMHPGPAGRDAVPVAPPFDHALGPELDRIARLAARACGMPAALIAIGTERGHEVVGRAGTMLDETLSQALPDGHATVDEAGTALPGMGFHAAQPLHGMDGQPLGSLCVVDTAPHPEGLDDDQRETLQTLADAATAILERRRLARAARDSVREAELASAEFEQRFQVLADAFPQLVWSTPANGMSDFFNAMWCAFTGAPAEQSYGTGWMDFLHPDDVERTGAVWRGAVARGSDYEIEYRLRHHAQGYRWVLARGEPLKAADGTVVRWLGTCTDIHETKSAHQQMEVLSRELSHRIKNIFAVIGGLIGLTTRRHPEYAPVGRDLQERVLALGRAHDFVRPQSEESRRAFAHTSLLGMLGELLAPYAHGAGAARIRIEGEDIAIDDRSATPLALAFHELATNAAKYGALSVADGRVSIHVGVEADKAVIAWHEDGGPPPRPDTRPGFGSSLIDLSLRLQLGGTVEYDRTRAEGMALVARLPMTAMSRD